MGAIEQHNILREGAFVNQVRQVLLANLDTLVLNDDVGSVPTRITTEREVNRHNFAARVAESPEGEALRVAKIILPQLNPVSDTDTWTDTEVANAIMAKLALITAPQRKPDGSPKDVTVQP